jgi:hypothetical protein
MNDGKKRGHPETLILDKGNFSHFYVQILLMKCSFMARTFMWGLLGARHDSLAFSLLR